MTESAAIALLIGDLAPEAGLVPPPGNAGRPSFLRWLITLVAAIYPTFTYGDEPQRWVPEGGPAEALRERTNGRREALWQMLEAAFSPDPWLLGKQVCALDVYVCVMTQWRPRRAWFAEHCPGLERVGRAMDGLPALAEVWRRNGLGGESPDSQPGTATPQ